MTSTSTSRYVDTFESEPDIDMREVRKRVNDVEGRLAASGVRRR